MKENLLKNSVLFHGATEEEIQSMLHCLQAVSKEFKKEEIIYHAGESADAIGLVLSGSIRIESDDIWGNKSILDHMEAGQIFAETYALLPGEALMVNVVAAQNSIILFFNAGRLVQTCPKACPFHNKIIRNLLSVCARKNLVLSRRIFLTSSKSIRGRVIAYLSWQAKQKGSHEFSIPFNRQQLADYLGVDRSALSSELSKMQREGLISYRKNVFTVKSYT